MLAIHDELVSDFAKSDDPISPPGVRSEGLLVSALSRPQTAMEGVKKYPTVEMGAAALLHSIVHDHPFHNGNKRTGMVSLLVFLDENGLLCTCDDSELFKMVVRLAQHSIVGGPRHELADREVLSVARWVLQNSRNLEKGDRPISARRFQRILQRYDCVTDAPSGGGSRLRISRSILRRRLFRTRSAVLTTQIYWAGDGREIERNTISKVRKDLQLDDLSGTDSAAFYRDAPTSASEFIVRYRKTLRRLAKI
jgi:death-on-curing family protein